MRLLIFKLTSVFTFLLVFTLLLQNPVMADFHTENNPGGEKTNSTTANKGIGVINEKLLGVPNDINTVISSVIQILYAIAGIVFFFMFLLGGIRYITAGGDEKAATAARSTLTQAVIGLVIVVSAFLITQLLFTIFGISSFIKLG